MTPRRGSEPHGPDVDIIKLARQSDDALRVLQTGQHLQIVVMVVPVGDETGEQTHEDSDQVLFFVDGHGEVVLDGTPHPVIGGHLVFVPAGTRHSISNTGGESLSIVSAYGPPEFEHGTVHSIRADADPGAP